VDEVSIILVYDAASLGILFPTFRENAVVFSSGVEMSEPNLLASQMNCFSLLGYKATLPKQNITAEVSHIRVVHLMNFAPNSYFVLQV
jgi:hypothetical protein